MCIKKIAFASSLLLTLTSAYAADTASTMEVPPPPEPPKIQRTEVKIVPHKPKTIKDAVQDIKTGTAKTQAAIKEIKIYEKPDENSKVVGTVKTDGSIIPIFREKDWTKVGNPKNGQTGWIPQAVLERTGVVQVHIRRSLHEGDTHRHAADMQIDDTVQDVFIKQQIIRERIENFMRNGMENFQQLNENLRKLLRLNKQTEQELNPLKTLVDSATNGVDDATDTVEHNTFLDQLKKFFKFDSNN